MDPATGSVIGGLGGGLLGIVGGLIQNAANKKAADKAFKRSLAADSSKYQRAVADLKAAGLNPILAVGGGIHGGSGVTSPSPMMSNVMEEASSSARDVAEKFQATKNAQAVQDNLEATRELIGAQVDETKQRKLQSAAETLFAESNTRFKDWEKQVSEALLPSTVRLNAANAARAEYQSVIESYDAAAAKFGGVEGALIKDARGPFGIGQGLGRYVGGEYRRSQERLEDVWESMKEGRKWREPGTGGKY